MRQEIKEFIEQYIGLIGVKDYELKTNEESGELLFMLYVPKSNNKRVGVLLGKLGRNLKPFNSCLKILGYMHEVKPTLIVKVID